MWYRAATVGKDGVYVTDLEIPIDRTLQAILEELHGQGHQALVVGGAVRDAVMGVVPKDIDVEVYGIDYAALVQLLRKYGRADITGDSFQVVKLRTPEGDDYDFSLPRRDNKKGSGHKGFDIVADPTMTPKEAASRRDFTMNSLAYNPVSGELHDYYGGLNDLHNGVLRATSSAFKEDPLRVLRGMQFAARYGLRLDPETAKTCREIVDSYGELAKERVSEEWMKLAIKGRHPGRALQYLADTGWLVHYPELEQMFGVPQDPEWHPEGWANNEATGDKQRLFSPQDHNADWADVGQEGKRAVWSREGQDADLYVTLDVPARYYDKYLAEQDSGALSLAQVGIRHLVVQYGGAELNKLALTHPEDTKPYVYGHAVRHGNDVELTVGFRGPLLAELRKRGCPAHVHVQMGDVVTHTAHVMDEAARIADRDGLEGDDRAVLVLAAMAHDLAKPEKTEFKDKPGRGLSVTSPGHEEAGAPLAESLLERMGIKRSIRARVVPLVKRHLAHINVQNNKSNVRKLAHDLHPSNIEELAQLVEADHSGRPPLPKELPEQAKALLKAAREQGVSAGKPEQLVYGRDVMPYFGGQTGPHVGDAVSAAYNAYLNGAYDDRAGAQTWLSNHLRSKANMLNGTDVLSLGVQSGPAIGRILEEAWQQQLSGAFTSREDALRWLASRAVLEPKSIA
ncbi:MAG: HD domain-containing protein [Armatimonadetes bacterium]|nr:HD domain-containing protein [Armatimonadota bacterium]